MVQSTPLVAVFGASSSSAADQNYTIAQRCGRLLAEAGFGVINGGYGGVMEAVSRSAAQAGGHVIGVTAPGVFPSRTGVNEFVADEITAPTLMNRIDTMLRMADASIALSGSIGTLTELMAAWNTAFVARFSSTPAKPVIALGSSWRHLIGDLTRELATDGSLVTCVDSVDEAVALLRRELLGPTA